MAYEVRIDAFEGPFDLLLHLILRQEVDLFEVSLNTIVDAYLDELDRLESLDLEIATEFLLIAATLVELKSRRLLPGPAELELDEELLRFEERDLLLARLLECKTFKDVAETFAGLMRRADRSLARRAGPEEPYRSMVPDPLERVRPQALRDAARRALAPRPVEVVDIDHIAPIRASVADAIATVLDVLGPPAGKGAARRTTFRELVADADDRLEVVVRFLAVLELFKQGLVELDQAANFGTLEIIRTELEPTALDALSVADWEGASLASGRMPARGSS